MSTPFKSKSYLRRWEITEALISPTKPVFLLTGSGRAMVGELRYKFVKILILLFLLGCQSVNHNQPEVLWHEDFETTRRMGMAIDSYETACSKKLSKKDMHLCQERYRDLLRNFYVKWLTSGEKIDYLASMKLYQKASCKLSKSFCPSFEGSWFLREEILCREYLSALERSLLEQNCFSKKSSLCGPKADPFLFFPERNACIDKLNESVDH